MKLCVWILYFLCTFKLKIISTEYNLPREHIHNLYYRMKKRRNFYIFVGIKLN